MKFLFALIVLASCLTISMVACDEVDKKAGLQQANILADCLVHGEGPSQAESSDVSKIMHVASLSNYLMDVNQWESATISKVEHDFYEAWENLIILFQQIIQDETLIPSGLNPEEKNKFLNDVKSIEEADNYYYGQVKDYVIKYKERSAGMRWRTSATPTMRIKVVILQDQLNGPSPRG